MTGITGKYKAYPDGIYLFKGNNTNTRKKVSNMFKVNNKKRLVLVFLLLTLNMFYTFF